MALIKTTPPAEAEGKLAELYKETEAMFGVVPNNAQILGVSPAILENQLDFIGYYRGHPTLSMAFLAMIRMLVAESTNSPYCVGLNNMLLTQVGLTAEQIEAAKTDADKVPMSDKEKALIKFVLKATKDPHGVTASDIDGLRGLGWSDQDIFDAVVHGARAVATNILFDVFKIELDLC
jgi:alkylhydroperoxidase family enzyme